MSVERQEGQTSSCGQDSKPWGRRWWMELLFRLVRTMAIGSIGSIGSTGSAMVLLVAAMMPKQSRIVTSDCQRSASIVKTLHSVT
mmetsp:Transcript_26468/g.48704  ORF Transcript_26468/g.48704 Transcript_26468/m.48704 type:complete len:85 (+) Transcript_26468:2896-3150(+)